MSAHAKRPNASLPPVILMGADTVNAISVIRSLGRAGVSVHLLCRPGATPSYSRYAHRLASADGAPPQKAWADYLQGPASEGLRGSVLLACNDAGMQVLMEHRDELAARYVLDISNLEAQRSLLNKLTTYQQAAEAGIPTPLYWETDSLERLHAHKDEYVYPLLVKPVYSHEFKRVFQGKYFRALDFSQLEAAFQKAAAHRLAVVLLEEIPGPDDLLCSYYTYLDESGEALFDFTKRIIRRYPEHEGFACYHVTDWNPEVRELGLRLFRHVGLVGLANVEFKRDTRDGKLKVIEVNARFTAANGLVAAAGYDLGMFVYSRLAGRPQPPLHEMTYKEGLHLWWPLDDFVAFLALRRQGRLSLRSWLGGLLHYQVLPYFDRRDPLPSLVRLRRRLQTLAILNAKRVVGRARLEGGE